MAKSAKVRVDPIPSHQTVLEWLDLSEADFTQLIRENPSLRNLIFDPVK
jgi:hypothetical protein